MDKQTTPMTMTAPNQTPIDQELNLAHPLESEGGEGLAVISARDIRSFAFHVLYVMEQFEYSCSVESVVDNLRRGYDIEVSDTSPAITLARGTVAERANLDMHIQPLLKNWRLERLGVCTRLILRMGIWELHNQPTPASIVINEAIELAKGFAEKDAYKFVNGVLDEVARRLGREVKQTEQSSSEEPQESSLKAE